MRGNCGVIFFGVIILALIFGIPILIFASIGEDVSIMGLIAGWIIVGFLIGCVERLAGYEAVSCGIPWGIWGIVAGSLMLLARNDAITSPYNSQMADVFLCIAIIAWVASIYSLIFSKGKRYVEDDTINGDVIDVKVYEKSPGKKNEQKRLRG